MQNTSLEKRRIDSEIKQLKLNHFEGVNWAVFNCHESDTLSGKSAVVRKFGSEGWKIVEEKMQTGIMELFHYPPTPQTWLYIKTVALAADARMAKQKREEQIQNSVVI